MATATQYAPPTTGLSTPEDPLDTSYRSLSRGAVLSLVLFVLALSGLIPTFEPMLALALLGIIAALMAIRTVRRYPSEYSGGLIAQAGLLLNAMLLVGGVTMHTYIYLTEVPEGYERVQFYELQTPERFEDAPTPRAISLDGKDIFLKGYIHPASGSGKLTRFVLVPDLGTCCFGGEPRSSSMVEVTLPSGKTVRAGKFKIKLAGKFMVSKYLEQTPEFENAVLYRLQADMVN